ncbi:MAG: Protoheme IX farnesyltransferase [Alphaproteobacteria bacterium MarineAlpha6_Bin6]|nr:protoheme IX farnesyltransferase [Pelagibacteraceae bacterium]PPR31901.1 MAG: Protoheme IX farnesyltransferase [Alphaproteobacteria bacterium MarineAlpha6_Bin6]PPR33553.1 MAG: Protoheme IX farnesyltransferase [Alphaproteobacteria bacterium MarineAlpha6_Bin5]|tara:strand:+ start:1345 stop:2265 length:921 start_codon:yes stop_codon:yes gene_type:complete
MIAKTASIYKKTSTDSDYIFFIKEYFSLVKPKVMTLVVFTAFTGIFIAPVTIHPWIAFISIFCIALGSGAAGAFNMWYEKELDLKMLRTRKRPLPSKVIKKNEALGIAIFLSFISVYVMALTVSYYAAAFLAFSIFFYVVIYTMWLKPRTKYNIVIGGAAGAFPPAIGWLSVTGSLDVLPFLMFLIIFMWTPPHFWALSLYCLKDYKTAGFPMLPVVSGIKKTKEQIVIYSILMFLITLIPFILGYFGMVYLFSSLILGLYFIFHSFKVYFDKGAENKSIKMFLYSIIYLYFLFLSMIIDHLGLFN